MSRNNSNPIRKVVPQGMTMTSFCVRLIFKGEDDRPMTCDTTIRVAVPRGDYEFAAKQARDEWADILISQAQDQGFEVLGTEIR